MQGFSSWAADGRIKTLVILGLILGCVALATYSYYTYRQSQNILGTNTISVSGKGEVFATPDIASFSFAVEAEASEAVAAQDKSAQVMNAILEHLKAGGVEEKDIKTSNYSLNPKYRWEQATCVQQWNCPPGKQILDGYQVNQTVTVKVRDTKKAGDLISSVGTKGATNISDISFTIDDDEKLKRDARELAIKDARANAEKLAQDLSIRLGRMVSYYENEGVMPMPMYANADMAGGMMKAERTAIAPSIPTGENTITSTVTLVYEIR